MENDFVEVRSVYPRMKGYEEWTVVTRFLAYGLVGVEMREILEVSENNPKSTQTGK